MTLTIDQYLYVMGGILVPVIGFIFFKKRNSSTTPKTKSTYGERYDELEQRIKKLEDDVVRNHIDIDEARLEIAYMRGRQDNE